MAGPVWTPRDWAAYRKYVRTNNDCEGYHMRLKKRCGNAAGVAFYLLIGVLHKEARLVTIMHRLVRDGKVSIYSSILKIVFNILIILHRSVKKIVAF